MDTNSFLIYRLRTGDGHTAGEKERKREVKTIE